MLKPHLREKRNEIIFALESQGYTFTEIGEMFNLNRSTTKRIIDEKPKDYKPKWIKAPQ